MNVPQEELDRLVHNLDPNVEMPKGFGLWSMGMIVTWLRQHQKKEKKRDKRTDGETAQMGTTRG